MRVSTYPTPWTRLRKPQSACIDREEEADHVLLSVHQKTG